MGEKPGLSGAAFFDLYTDPRVTPKADIAPRAAPMANGLGAFGHLTYALSFDKEDRMKTIRDRSLIVATALLGALASGAAPSNAQTIDPRIGDRP